MTMSDWLSPNPPRIATTLYVMKYKEFGPFKSHSGTRIMTFLNNGNLDYLSSRILFNKDKIIQACFLANTAVEKIFKSIIYIGGRETRKTHVLTNLYPTVINTIPQLKDIINYEFIVELSKIYKCRYTDDLENNFNVVIVKRKYLSELDELFHYVNNRLKIRTSHGEMKSRYIDWVENNEHDLYLNNYLLESGTKTDFVEQIDFVTEFRVLSNGETLEVMYPTNQSRNDGNFNYEGLAPSTNNSNGYAMSHKLIENPKVPTENGWSHLNDIKSNEHEE